MSIQAENSQVVPIQNANVNVTRGDVFRLGKTITSPSTVLGGDSNGYKAGLETGRALTSSIAQLAIPNPTLPQAAQMMSPPAASSAPAGHQSLPYPGHVHPHWQPESHQQLPSTSGGGPPPLVSSTTSTSSSYDDVSSGEEDDILDAIAEWQQVA